MSFIYYDSDEWEQLPGESRPCTACRDNPDGGMRICTGMCNGMVSIGGQRRRAPEEVARIKADRERARQDAVLAEADAIRRRRLAVA